LRFGVCSEELIKNIAIKVFKTAEFVVDQDVVNEFLTPALVTKSEALGSPPKRRLSIEGRVTYVCLGLIS